MVLKTRPLVVGVNEVLEGGDGGRYLVKSVLGAGDFSTVFECVDMDTDVTVAVKIVEKQHAAVAEKEVSILETVKALHPDRCGLLSFHKSFWHNGHRCLVFEILDCTLLDFINDRGGPLSLMEIRPIIQQLAIALLMLQTVGLIHGDIKADNIMLVDQHQRPIRVKLIDFGLATDVSEVQQGCRMQHPYFRAPEVSLGLPITEAVDMWSLGCFMTATVLGEYLFTGNSEYEVMRSIMLKLGMPSQSLLDDGSKSQELFVWDKHAWRLKTPQEYEAETGVKTEENWDSLGRLGFDDDTDPYHKALFMDLMKRMLHWDARERITPIEVLAHPFITMPHPVAQSSYRLNCLLSQHKCPLSVTPANGKCPLPVTPTNGKRPPTATPVTGRFRKWPLTPRRRLGRTFKRRRILF